MDSQSLLNMLAGALLWGMTRWLFPGPLTGLPDWGCWHPYLTA